MEELKMNLNDLRLFTACYINEHDVDPEDRSTLFAYIKEADENELLTVLVKGDFAESLTESEINTVVNYVEPLVEFISDENIDTLLTEVSLKDVAFDTQKRARGLKKSVPHKFRGAAKTAGEKLGKLSSKAGEKMGAAKFDVQAKARGLKKSLPHQARGAARKTADAAKQVGKGAKALATSPGGKAVAAVAVAAAAAAAGIKAYQRFFSQAAKACKGAADRSACLSKYRKTAQQAKINALQKGMAQCSSAKNPDKCKGRIQAKVQKAKAQMAKL
jgi:hypothetical protein